MIVPSTRCILKFVKVLLLYSLAYLSSRTVILSCRLFLWCDKFIIIFYLFTYLHLHMTELCQPCSDTRLRSTSRGDFIVPRFNCQLSNSSFSVAAPSAWNRLPSHIRTSSTYTLFLTGLKTHLFTESLLWHCYAVVFSLYFWRPRALDVGRHSNFMLINWLCLLSDGVGL